MNRLAIAAAALAALTVGGSADAAQFAFSYTTISGVTASGTLDATNVGGFYTVDGVSGSRGTATITGYDYFDPTPQSFNYAGGAASNVDFSYYVGADNYEIRFPGNSSSFGSEFRTDSAGAVTSLLVTSFTLRPAATPAVPEPASWALMLAGFAAAGVALRRRRAPAAALA